jgi:hypothetical protein
MLISLKSVLNQQCESQIEQSNDALTEKLTKDRADAEAALKKKYKD